MVANEVNKFEQISPIHSRRKYEGNFHSSDFTPKVI
jgi:hypothetical protein